MIVTPTDGQLMVITQCDHAHFASELLSVWRAGGLPEHPRRRDLLLAAREHDNGWREVDAAPICRTTDRRPHDFLSVPRELRWDIWRRGTRRLSGEEPVAALLIVRHAIHLHRAHRDDAKWQEIFSEWQELEAELFEQIGIEPAALSADYRWIDSSDALSLATCNRWTDPFEAHGTRAEVRVDPGRDPLNGTVLTLAPFPLAGTTTLSVAYRLIPDRRYTSDTDLGTELATSRWQQCRVRITPP